LNGGFSYAALYKFGELLGNYRVEKKSLSFGATFIPQKVQLLACLHALGGPLGLGRCRAARFSASFSSIKSILNPTLALV